MDRNAKILFSAIAFLICTTVALVSLNLYASSNYRTYLLEHNIPVGNIHFGGTYIIINQEEFLELAKEEKQAYVNGIYFLVHHDGIWYSYMIKFWRGYK